MFPLYDENPRSSRPYVNYALILVNFIVFFWEVSVTGFFSSEKATLAMFMDYGFVPAKFLDGLETFRIGLLFPAFSSMFMHSSIMHILGNMLFLWIFGDNIEDRFGHGKYLAIYLFWGFVASMAHLVWAVGAGGENLLIPAVGASGAVSGVLGAYLLMFPHARIVTMVFYFFITTTRIPAYAYLVLWFIFQLFAAGAGGGGGVAYVAHIGGFAAGMVFGLGYKQLSRARLRMLTMPGREAGEREEVRPEAQTSIRPLRMEGITTDKYVELLVEMPGIDERTISVNASGSTVLIGAVTADGRRRYSGRAILHAKIRQQPEFVQYLNGILRVRFARA